LRLPFSSPPTTRRVTEEVFDPASTRVAPASFGTLLYNHFARTPQKTQLLYYWEDVFTVPLHGNGVTRLLLVYPLPRECIYRVVVEQWTSIPSSLFRLSGVMSQYVHMWAHKVAGSWKHNSLWLPLMSEYRLIELSHSWRDLVGQTVTQTHSELVTLSILYLGSYLYRISRTPNCVNS
jgi:hypothetical protein